ncbi:MAG: RNA polymerase sigma factor [Planctomycetes bacterium]|nr:RNA polymerase sigma factor [Planctomycetota bacterium]
MPTDPFLHAHDEELLTRARSGDVDAENLLFSRHLEAAYAFARRTLNAAPDAEDAVGEALLKAHNALRAFRGECTFRTWLFGIVARCAVDVLRARGSRHEAPEGSPAERRCAPEGDPGSSAEIGEALDHALAALPQRARQAIHLRVRQELSYREIAIVLQISEEAARAAVFDARRRLEKLLARFLEPAEALSPKAEERRP